MSDPKMIKFKFRDSLIVYIYTPLHDKSAMKFRNDILRNLQENKSKNLILDVSAIDIVDSFLGRIIIETAMSAKVIGVRPIISGLKPDIALSLIEMGFKIRNDIEVATDIDQALEMT